MNRCTRESHAAAAADDAQWNAMTCIGEQVWPWGERLELRNCHCGSTLCRTVAEPEAANVPA